MSFKKVSIGSIADFINGYAFKPSDRVEGSKGLKIIRIQNLTDPTKSFNRTTKKVPEKYLVQEGDVLISWSATIDVFRWENGPALLNQHIFKVEFDHSKIYDQFFIYVLKHTIEDLTKHAHGTTMKHVTKSDFVNHKIPLPSIVDQIRIAKVIGKAEQLIKQRKESIALADKFLKMKFLEMFGDPFSNKKNWKTNTLGQLSEVGTGATPSRRKETIYYNGDVSWVKTGEVNGGYIYQTEEKITEQALEETNCSIYPVDTILIAMYGQGKTRGQVGVLKVEAATNQACAAILPSDKIDQVFLFNLLKLNYQKLRNLSRGGNQKNLNLTIVRGLEIILPPLELQTKFSSIVKHVEKIKRYYKESLTELNKLHGSLSQRAFKGELDLNNVEVEENEVKAPEGKSLYDTIEKILEKEDRKDLDQFIDKEFIDKGYEGDTALFLSQALKAELKKIDEAPVNAPEYHLLMLVIETLREREESFSFEQFWDIIHSELEEEVDYEDIKRVLFTWLKGEQPLLTQQFSEDEKQIKFLFNEAS